MPFWKRTTWRVSPPAHCKAKLFPLCLHVSTAAKCAATVPVPTAKTEEETGCCLKAEWLSACKTLCCRGVVTRLQWAKSSSPLYIPLSEKGLPAKPCVLSSFLLVDPMARDGPGDRSLLPSAPPTHRHCSSCSLWLLQTLWWCGKSQPPPSIFSVLFHTAFSHLLT